MASTRATVQLPASRTATTEPGLDGQDGIELSSVGSHDSRVPAQAVLPEHEGGNRSQAASDALEEHPTSNDAADRPGSSQTNDSDASPGWKRLKELLVKSKKMSLGVFIVTVLGLAINAALAQPAFIGARYSEDSMNLAAWEAAKDFKDICQSILSTTNFSTPECQKALDMILPPPPLFETVAVDTAVHKSVLQTLRRNLNSTTVGDTQHTWIHPSPEIFYDGLPASVISTVLIFAIFLLARYLWRHKKSFQSMWKMLTWSGDTWHCRVSRGDTEIVRQWGIGSLFSKFLIWLLHGAPVRSVSTPNSRSPIQNRPLESVISLAKCDLYKGMCVITNSLLSYGTAIVRRVGQVSFHVLSGHALPLKESDNKSKCAPFDDQNLIDMKFEIILLLRLRPEVLCSELRGTLDLSKWQDSRKRSLLSWAVAYGKKEAVDLLLDQGADPNSKDDLEDTPLHLAIQNNKYLSMPTNDSRWPSSFQNFDPNSETRPNSEVYDSIFLALLNFGSDIHAKNYVGSTPLHEIAQSGSATQARLSLDRGADIMRTSEFGETCLETAVKFNNHAVLQVFLDEFYERQNDIVLIDPELVDQNADSQTRLLLTKDFWKHFDRILGTEGSKGFGDKTKPNNLLLYSPYDI